MFTLAHSETGSLGRSGRSLFKRLCTRNPLSRANPGCVFGRPWDQAAIMAPGAGDKKAEKSYLASAVDSINPWAGNRTSTATPKEPQPSPTIPASSGDHIINPLYGKSFKTYPPDCPKLNVQWFHAADVSVLNYLPDSLPYYDGIHVAYNDSCSSPSGSPSSFRRVNRHPTGRRSRFQVRRSLFRSHHRTLRLLKPRTRKG